MNAFKKNPSVELLLLFFSRFSIALLGILSHIKVYLRNVFPFFEVTTAFKTQSLNNPTVLKSTVVL